MNKTIILISKKNFIFNNEEYEFDKIKEMSHLFKSNMKIIILQEDLYVKQFVENVKNRKINEFVNKKINNDFPQTGDLLYDFEKVNNRIAIYSLKGARRVECLSSRARSLEVKPIQVIIKEIIFKILRKNNLNIEVLTEYKGYYYLTSFKDGLFNYGIVNENQELILDSIIENSDFEEIYTDENTFNKVSPNDKLKIIKLNLGELINEKIYEKQKFHSR